MTTKINVGIIGAGRIGRVHAENLIYRVPEARVLAVSDVFLEAAQKCAADFNIPTAVKNHQAILDNPEIEAVIICSSTDTHAQFISEAAAAGKHIFCEKPIALDLKVIDAALAAVEQHGVKLQIGFNRRFDPNFKQARDMVAAGKIGAPHLVRITSRDPAPPPLDYVKVSGGIFLDMTIHDFDMARYLIGSEVTEIFAAGAVLVDPAIGQAGDVDTAVVTLRYANGAIGTIDNSRRAVYGYDQRVEVFGSEGVVVVANNTPHNAVYSNTEGVHSALPLYFFLERYTEAYVAEMKAFILAIAQDTAPPVTGLDGRIPVVMGQAAWKSYRENRPVKLSEIGL
ncbi:MAG: inositol 2-dehydrogenase [Anaerolineae bacterium]|nr:inositol 2-dehydrogenase [Anaerolineales bacterium]MCQ3977315.1 inositol 2-dehydrogenase [Anaerolineae bacterium]